MPKLAILLSQKSPLIPFFVDISKGEWRSVEHTEVKSGNARTVILSYNEKIYYINRVNAQIREGNEKIKAVFHGKRAGDHTPEDLDIEINKATYDILMEYAKLDKLDLIMVLQIQGSNAKWCLLNEDWLNAVPAVTSASSGYVV